jgi:hypothetical protein
MGQRSKKKNITLDSFIIFATPYDNLYKRYESGTWDREKFAEQHILFPEQKEDYDYFRIRFMSMK